MTEEFTRLYEQSIRSQQEILRLKESLKAQEQAHESVLLQCYIDIIDELDSIDAAARAQLATLKPGSEAYENANGSFRQLRQPLLSILEKQGIRRIPAPFNLLPEWSVFESASGEERPADRAELAVEKEGYSKGDWLIRPAELVRIK